MEGQPKGIQVHKFYLSYKIAGDVHTGWFYGVHIRFAKDQLLFQHPEATDIMDWTYEKSKDLRSYLMKHNALKMSIMLRLKEQSS